MLACCFVFQIFGKYIALFDVYVFNKKWCSEQSQEFKEYATLFFITALNIVSHPAHSRPQPKKRSWFEHANIVCCLFFSLFVSILINYCYNYHLLTQYTRWVNRSAKPKCCATYSPMKDMQEHELIFRQPVVLDEIEQNFGNNMQPATGKSVTEEKLLDFVLMHLFLAEKKGDKE